MSLLKKTFNKKMSQYPKVAYLHIPKCGGIADSDGIFSAIYPKWIKARLRKGQ